MKPSIYAIIVAVLALMGFALYYVGLRLWEPPEVPVSFVPPAHELLVANFGGDSIAGFEILSNGSVAMAPSRMIIGGNTGLDDPIDVAVDSSGNILVLNAGLTLRSPSITMYAPDAHGNVAPILTVSDPLFVKPQGLALVSASSAVWVANWVDPPVATNASGILRLAMLTGGAPPPVTRLLATASPPNGLAHHPSIGYVFAPLATTNSIVVMASNTFAAVSAPVTTILGSNTLLDQPSRAAVDAAGTLYVVNRGNQTIAIYETLAVTSGTSMNVAPSSRLFPGPLYRLSSPQAITVGSAGRLFVGDGDRLIVINDQTPSGPTSGFVFGQEITSQPVPGLGVGFVPESLVIPMGLALRCSAPDCPSP